MVYHVNYKNEYDLYRQIIKEYPLLTKEQEIGKAKSGDIEGLVLHNIRIPIKIASKFHQRSIAYEDIVAYAVLGLIIAARSFDYTKGYRFSTYAYVSIPRVLLREILNENLQLPPSSSEDIELRDSMIKLMNERCQKKVEYAKKKREKSKKNDEIKVKL